MVWFASSVVAHTIGALPIPDKAKPVEGRTTDQAVRQLVHGPSLQLDHPLQCLSVRHIHSIDDALAEIGDYGEVRLIKNRNKLRFIQTVTSQPLLGGE